MIVLSMERKNTEGGPHSDAGVQASCEMSLRLSRRGTDRMFRLELRES